MIEHFTTLKMNLDNIIILQLSCNNCKFKFNHYTIIVAYIISYLIILEFHLLRNMISKQTQALRSSIQVSLAIRGRLGSKKYLNVNGKTTNSKSTTWGKVALK